MFVTFEKIPSSAKIWVYFISQNIDNQQIDKLNVLLVDFLDVWTAHQQNLAASFQLIDNKILIIAVDEQHSYASGCSIDSSVKALKSIEQQLSINLLESNLVLFENENKIFGVYLNEIKKNIDDKIITKDTFLYDRTLTNLNDWQQKGKIKVGESWAKRYFN
ncbi:MAG: hypothetical protein EAZ20_00615 [Bacteroidetes bacterium]|nr:MAG: hypothetical protein EAZ20_00615 [Bacteroidota bacterium]